MLADGKYVKVYVDDTRVLNVPNADLMQFFGQADGARLAPLLLELRAAGVLAGTRTLRGPLRARTA